MMKAIDGDINVESTFENLNKCFNLARNIKLTDIIDPNSKQIGELAELVYRLQNCPDFEIINIEGEA